MAITVKVVVRSLVGGLFRELLGLAARLGIGLAAEASLAHYLASRAAAMRQLRPSAGVWEVPSPIFHMLYGSLYHK